MTSAGSPTPYTCQAFIAAPGRSIANDDHTTGTDGQDVVRAKVGFKAIFRFRFQRELQLLARRRSHADKAAALIFGGLLPRQ
jgi:hypothetical protein